MFAFGFIRSPGFPSLLHVIVGCRRCVAVLQSLYQHYKKNQLFFSIGRRAQWFVLRWFPHPALEKKPRFGSMTKIQTNPSLNDTVSITVLVFIRGRDKFWSTLLWFPKQVPLYGSTTIPCNGILVARRALLVALQTEQQ
jgi:hypothetical protein